MLRISRIVGVVTAAASIWGVCVAAQAASQWEGQVWWERLEQMRLMAGDSSLSGSERTARIVDGLRGECAVPTPTPAAEDEGAVRYAYASFHEISLMQYAQALRDASAPDALRAALAAATPGSEAEDWLLVGLGLAGIQDVPTDAGAGGDGAVLKRLADLATSDPSDFVRSWAARALGGMQDRQAAKAALLPALEDPTWRLYPPFDPNPDHPEYQHRYLVREGAAQALRKLGYTLRSVAWMTWQVEE